MDGIRRCPVLPEVVLPALAASSNSVQVTMRRQDNNLAVDMDIEGG